MKHSIFLAFALILSLMSCKTQERLPLKPSTQESENTKVNTRIETIYVTDTFYIEIPAQITERVTPDSSSILENDYAISKARINVDGTLFHNLMTKPQEIPIKKDIPTTVVTKDSVVCKTKLVEVPTPVERELTWWEQTRLKGFFYLAGIVLILLFWTFRKPILNLIRRFI